MQDIQHQRDSDFTLWKFLAAFLVAFFLISVFLYTIDFVPESPEKGAPRELAGTTPASAPLSAKSRFPIEVPLRIAAPAVGINAPVESPSSTDLSVLDDTLLKGAVRYPGSGFLGDDARMYIFGHQSYLPIVHNQAYKSFNGLQKLKEGDEILVYSATAAYKYRVLSLTRTTATAGVVALGGGDRALTLSTCDVFGSTNDRWEVVAEFVSKESMYPAS